MSRSRVLALCSVLTLAVPVSLLAPGSASAAVDSDVYTWGSNGFGQLGDGSAPTAVRGTPDLVPVSSIVEASGGREHVLALTDDGTVVTWGSDAFGQLGNGLPLGNQSSPITVDGLSGVVDVDDGHYHSLALKSDGTVWGWGQNSLGQLAQGNDSDRVPSPAQWGTVSNAVGIFGGRDMTYVLTDSGSVLCSGGRGLECGRATGSEITDPVTVNGLPDIVDIAGGRNHAVALADDGTVWTWGMNDFGQLGDDSKTDRATPQQVAGLSGVVDVGAGAEHSLAVTSGGHVYTWGRNFRAELGLGNTVDRDVPVEVPGLSGIVEVDAGRSHSFAITGDGRLWAWGWNEFQQVNTSADDTIENPFQVSGVTDVVAAGGGQAYSFALTEPEAAVLSDGFDTGLSNWTVTGRLKVDNTRWSPVGEAPSVRASVTSRKAGAVRPLPNNLDDACAQAWVRPVSAGTVSALVALRDSSGALIAQLQLRPNGALRARSDIDKVTAAAGAKLPFNQWSKIELCTSNSATDTVSVSVGGVEVGSWNWTTTAAGQVQVGSLKKSTVTVNIDDVAVL